MFNKVLLIVFLAICTASANTDVESNRSEGFRISGILMADFQSGALTMLYLPENSPFADQVLNSMPVLLKHLK